ncbi:MAG: hypothetical protein RL325_1674 [Planctomycetota bacterium]
MSLRSAAFAALAVALAASLGVANAVARSSSGEPGPGFDAEVRAILSENCFQCHGMDASKRAADLRLDLAASAIRARAIVPGDADESKLVERILSRDPDRIMPPPSSHRALDAGQRATLVRWIESGARYEPHWAFVAPRAIDAGDAPNLIDALVERRLAREGLALAPEADRATLVRRASLDLVGLPPSPEEVEAFVADAGPGAYERLVDRLLASPHYGERMALPWLDAARYADSNGFQQDGDTFQWVWRDWLVDALNRDVPYDRLSTLLLAGDLVGDGGEGAVLASAFNRNHLLNGEGGAIPEENRWVSLFDRVDTTATTWLGLTMSCAQCHDHKYDPISQRDYYALLDAFNRVPERGIVDGSPSRFRIAPPVLEVADSALRARRAELEDAARAGADGAQGRLEQFLRDGWPRVMVMSDAAPRTTHVLSRGDYLSPLEPVAFATPAFLPPLDPALPRDRLGLARWLFAPDNPLVARVAVNRAWQVFFGDGLVRTPEDFGVQGDRPVHRELLDALAVWHREGGWSTKALHRLIVTSRTYRQSSAASDSLRARDPDNRLLARGPRHRLPAMLIRDAALAASGLLDARVGGAPVYPYQPERVWESLAITKERDFAYPASRGADLYRRSLYTFWRRTIAPANMFDVSQRQSCRVRVATTSSPLHALTTLNDPTFVEAARALAERVMRGGGARAEQLEDAFRRVVCRAPTVRERERLETLLERQRAHFAADPATAARSLSAGESARDAALDPVDHAAMSAACLAILNLDEALTRE